MYTYVVSHPWSGHRSQNSLDSQSEFFSQRRKDAIFVRKNRVQYDMYDLGLRLNIVEYY